MSAAFRGPGLAAIRDLDRGRRPIPRIEDASPAGGTSGGTVLPADGRAPGLPATSETAPRLRTCDRRLAGLVDACYPPASLRLGEEGRAVARVAIASGGDAAAWSDARSFGFRRLDDAVGCVLRQLEFVPGRRDGRVVDAEVLLPIVFRLN